MFYCALFSIQSTQIIICHKLHTLSFGKLLVCSKYTEYLLSTMAISPAFSTPFLENIRSVWTDWYFNTFLASDSNYFLAHKSHTFDSLIIINTQRHTNFVNYKFSTVWQLTIAFSFTEKAMKNKTNTPTIRIRSSSTNQVEYRNPLNHPVRFRNVKQINKIQNIGTADRKFPFNSYYIQTGLTQKELCIRRNFPLVTWTIAQVNWSCHEHLETNNMYRCKYYSEKHIVFFIIFGLANQIMWDNLIWWIWMISDDP